MGCSRQTKSASVTAACKLTWWVAASVRGTISCLPVLRYWAHAARSRTWVTVFGIGCRESGFERGRGTCPACPGSVLFAEVNERRLAQRSHFGCGRCGRRRPSFMGGDHPRRSDVVSCSAGRRSGLAKGLRRAPRWWKVPRTVGSLRSARGVDGSGLGRAVWFGVKALGHCAVTEAPESCRFPPQWWPRTAAGSGNGWAKRAARRVPFGSPAATRRCWDSGATRVLVFER